MRSSSQDLAEATLAAARGALDDLQQQTLDAMREIIGDEMTDVATGKANPMKAISEAEHRFTMSAEEAMRQLDKLRRQGGLE